jgi:hypothetical protein
MSPSDKMDPKTWYDDGPTVLRYPRGTGFGADKLQSLFATSERTMKFQQRVNGYPYRKKAGRGRFDRLLE